jgi:hypothetical protein
MRHEAGGLPYNYRSMEEAANAAVRSLEGRVLERALVQVVAPEFNVLYLLCDDQSFAVQGRVGGEVLEIVPMDKRPAEGRLNDCTSVVAFPAFEQFARRRIASARMIGCAWNGHGFELSFDGIFDRTMIVQSIHTGADPPDFSDCLRLGVGVYHFAWPLDGGVA